jgi:hypothetical protein
MEAAGCSETYVYVYLLHARTHQLVPPPLQIKSVLWILTLELEEGDGEYILN